MGSDFPGRCAASRFPKVAAHVSSGCSEERPVVFREAPVVATVGFGAILLGTALTVLGTLFPKHVSAMEFAGGTLLITGLVMIGSRLAVFRF